MTVHQFIPLLLLGLLLTLIHNSCCSSFDRLKFTPLFPSNHKWDYACQRILTLSNDTFYDIDYQLMNKRTTVRLVFSVSAVLSQLVEPTWFVAYATTDMNDTIAGDFTYQNITMRQVSFQDSVLNKDYQVSEDIIVPATTSLFVAFGYLVNNNSDREVVHEQWLQFNDTALYNRSQCYDLANYHHFVRQYYLQDCKIAFIIHFIFLVPMLLMFVLSIVTCRGHLAKRRSPASIIGNVSMLVVFVVSLPFYNGVSFSIYKRSVRGQLSIKGWYTYIQVIGIIIGLVIAVTAYLATMLRYFHLKLMYKLSFSASNTSETPMWKKIVVSKWFYWPVFAVSITVLYTVLAGVTLGLRYAHKRFLIIYTALDILDIDFLVVLGILLIIYAVDLLANIRKLVQKGPLYFFWANDPLLFRLEALIAVWFFAAMTAGIIVYFRYPALYPYARGISFVIAYFFALPLFGNGLITLIQVKRYLTRCFNPADEQVGKQDMLHLLEDDQFYALFMRYTKQEFSYENLYIYSLLVKVKSKGTMDFDSFQEIFNKYIRSGSMFELNLPSAIQQKYSKLFQDIQENKKTLEYEGLYELHMEVITNLQDTFNRFKETTVYQLYKREKEAFHKEFHLDVEIPDSPHAPTTPRNK